MIIRTVAVAGTSYEVSVTRTSEELPFVIKIERAGKLVVRRAFLTEGNALYVADLWTNDIREKRWSP